MKQIPLTKGKFALVDDEDYDFLMRWKWYYHKSGYAVRSENYIKTCGEKACRMIRMHRVVNKTPDGLQTDHINMDKLDNRNQNLRSCTKAQNQMNRVAVKNSSSKYKGVSWDKDSQKWVVRIKINGKLENLGRFISEIKAAKSYNSAALEHFGEFARLNKVQETVLHDHH